MLALVPILLMAQCLGKHDWYWQQMAFPPSKLALLICSGLSLFCVWLDFCLKPCERCDGSSRVGWIYSTHIGMKRLETERSFWPCVFFGFSYSFFWLLAFLCLRCSIMLWLVIRIINWWLHALVKWRFLVSFIYSLQILSCYNFSIFLGQRLGFWIYGFPTSLWMFMVGEKIEWGFLKDGFTLDVKILTTL